MLLAGDLHDDHFEQFGRMLGEIHAHAYERQDEVAVAFADTSFFESLRLATRGFNADRANSEISISAMFSQLPCLGVCTNSSRRAMGCASSGENALYKEAGL